jgi:hypothetical protein
VLSSTIVLNISFKNDPISFAGSIRIQVFVIEYIDCHGSFAVFAQLAQQQKVFPVVDPDFADISRYCTVTLSA